MESVFGLLTRLWISWVPGGLLHARPKSSAVVVVHRQERERAPLTLHRVSVRWLFTQSERFMWQSGLNISTSTRKNKHGCLQCRGSGFIKCFTEARVSTTAKLILPCGTEECLVVWQARCAPQGTNVLAFAYFVAAVLKFFGILTWASWGYATGVHWHVFRRRGPWSWVAAWVKGWGNVINFLKFFSIKIFNKDH